MFVAIFGGIVSSGDVSSDTWTFSGHYSGIAYKGWEPYEVEKRVRTGSMRCKCEWEEGVGHC